MSEYRFLYWDDYGTSEGDKGGARDGSTDSPKNDSKESRSEKDTL